MLITKDNQTVAKLIRQPQAARKPPQPGSAKGMLIINVEDDEHLKDFAEYMPADWLLTHIRFCDMSWRTGWLLMDTKQLDDALARLFVDDGERIVFWHDPAQEFLDFMNRLPFLTFGNTTVHIIRLDQVSLLATKIRLERDEPDSRFLLYAPTEEPDYADDWLLDIRLYSRSFRADRASIILDELGLENHHLRDHLSQRRRFFDNKERLQKLKTLVTSTDTAVDLDRKMLAVVVKADQPELFTILRTLFHTWTDVEDTDAIDLGEPPACWEQIDKFDLAQSFWQVSIIPLATVKTRPACGTCSFGSW